MANFSLYAVLANNLYNSIGNYRFKFKTKNLTDEVERFMDNLQRVSYLTMEKYGQEVRQQMVARFVATQKYRKPKRRTNNLRRAIDQHSVIQSRAKGSEYVELKIGNALEAPIYTEVQEKGHTKAFQFWQKFQRVRGYPSAPRYPFRASYRLLSHTKQWFASHPNVKPYLIRVKNPGIKPRGFIKAGVDYIHQTLPTTIQEIIKGAMQ